MRFFFTVILFLFMASPALANSLCLKKPAPYQNKIFIYSGTRDAALKEFYSDSGDIDDSAATYFIQYITSNELVDYFLAQPDDLRTPENFWAASALKFEFPYSDGICRVVLDDLDLYIQMQSSESFVVRKLQYYEKTRIIKNVKENRTVY